MSLLPHLGDQMHALAVEISDHMGSSGLHPYCDSVGEFSDPCQDAQAYGDLLAADDLHTFIEAFTQHVRQRLLYWQNQEGSAS